jgi:hypothetical protein
MQSDMVLPSSHTRVYEQELALAYNTKHLTKNGGGGGKLIYNIKLNVLNGQDGNQLRASKAL